MVEDGELAKLYDKWFMQPIPPTNTKVGLPLSDATKAAWANPNNKPMEDYAQEVTPSGTEARLRPRRAFGGRFVLLSTTIDRGERMG